MAKYWNNHNWNYRLYIPSPPAAPRLPWLLRLRLLFNLFSPHWPQSLTPLPKIYLAPTELPQLKKLVLAPCNKVFDSVRKYFFAPFLINSGHSWRVQHVSRIHHGHQPPLKTSKNMLTGNDKPKHVLPIICRTLLEHCAENYQCVVQNLLNRLQGGNQRNTSSAWTPPDESFKPASSLTRPNRSQAGTEWHRPGCQMNLGLWSFQGLSAPAGPINDTVPRPRKGWTSRNLVRLSTFCFDEFEHGLSYASWQNL